MKYLQSDEKFWADYQRRLEELDKTMTERAISSQPKSKKRSRLVSAYRQQKYKAAA